MRSSSRAKPIIKASIFKSRLNAPTMGIEPPQPAKTASLPHSDVSARRARARASEPKGNCSAPDAPWARNSTFASAGSRARTKARKLSKIALGSWLPTKRNENFAEACAGKTVLEPLPV